MESILDLDKLRLTRIREALEVAREYLREEAAWSVAVGPMADAVDCERRPCEPLGGIEGRPGPDPRGLSLVGALRRASGDEGTLLGALAHVHGHGPGLEQAMIHARLWEHRRGEDAYDAAVLASLEGRTLNQSAKDALGLDQRSQNHEELMAAMDAALEAAAQDAPPPALRGRAHGLRLLAAAIWRPESGNRTERDIALDVCSEEELEDWRHASHPLSEWTFEGEKPPRLVVPTEDEALLIEDAEKLEEAALLTGALPRSLNLSATAVLSGEDLRKAARLCAKGGASEFEQNGVCCVISESAVEMSVVDDGVEAVVVDVPDGDPLPILLLRTNRRISFVAAGPGTADVLLTGPGDGDVHRLGGLGDAIRAGDGKGDAICFGPGTARRNGAGMGDAVNGGDGDALRLGRGCGDAVCRGSGTAVREGEWEFSVGCAKANDGHAERSGPGHGDAHALGEGTARHDGRSVGRAYGPPPRRKPAAGMSP